MADYIALCEVKCYKVLVRMLCNRICPKYKKIVFPVPLMVNPEVSHNLWVTQQKLFLSLFTINPSKFPASSCRPPDTYPLLAAEMGPAAPSCTGSPCPAEACHTEPQHKSAWGGSHRLHTSCLEGSRQWAVRPVGVVLTQVRQREQRSSVWTSKPASAGLAVKLILASYPSYPAWWCRWVYTHVAAVTPSSQGSTSFSCCGTCGRSSR